MTLEMEIREQSCRGCRICADVCPTQVVIYDEAQAKARAGNAADCIACLSCVYACPSGAIAHRNYHKVRNFYRDLDFVSRMERFL
jgi:formate hydrogenlyase subunit 6/NADH:ubiquinone oxidoreductase subunit I